MSIEVGGAIIHLGADLRPTCCGRSCRRWGWWRKVLTWDGTSVIVVHKTLDAGRFGLPRATRVGTLDSRVPIGLVYIETVRSGLSPKGNVEMSTAEMVAAGAAIQVELVGVNARMQERDAEEVSTPPDAQPKVKPKGPGAETRWRRPPSSSGSTKRSI